MNKNIQMKKREGDSWDNLFPLTLMENVYDNTGLDLTTKLENLNDTLNQSIETGITMLNEEMQTGFKQRVVLIHPEYSQSEIQSLLDNGGQFKFMSGIYRVDVENGGIGYDIKDNTLIEFADGAEVHLIPTQLDDYRIINIEKRENVTIRRAVVHGDKHTHLGTGGEWGHGYSIRGSKNVTLERCQAHECWGDGLYVGQSTDYSIDNSENTIVRDFIADDNRRQGISVTGVIDLYMANLILKNTAGTPPSAGIDLEANNNRNEMKNVVIDGIYTENNSIGIDIHLASILGVNHKEISIVINDHESVNDGVGMGSRIPTSTETGRMSGRVITKNPLWKNSRANGLHATWVSNRDIQLIVENPKIINPNTGGTSNLAGGSAIRLGDRGSDLSVGNILIDKLDLTYPDSNPTFPLVVDGSSVENLMFLDPVDLGSFTGIRTNYGSFTVRDPKGLLKNTSDSSRTSVSVNYSSIYSTINRDSNTRYDLSDEIVAGSSDITFIAENGTIDLYPDSNSSILPYGGAGEVVRIGANSMATLRRKSSTEWQVVNEVGTIGLHS